MKILHVTDLHGHLPWYEWLARQAGNYDLVCVSGDLIDAGDFVHQQIADVTAVLSSIKVPLAICSGNHDQVARAPEMLQAAWIKDLRRGGVWVDGDRFQLHGRSFYCHGWEEPIRESYRDEIWIMHAPPARTAIARSRRDGCDHGDFEFGQLCHSGHGPRLALCGHVHEPKAWHDWAGRTQVFNPASLAKELLVGHLVVDFQAGTATRLWPGGPGQIQPLAGPTSGEILRYASPRRRNISRSAPKPKV